MPAALATVVMIKTVITIGSTTVAQKPWGHQQLQCAQPIAAAGYLELSALVVAGPFL
jgi:hypothetical protein